MNSRLGYMLLVTAMVFPAAWAAETPNASAKNVSKHALPTLSMLDKNQDGLISRDEGLSDEDVSRYWDKLDTNLDGNLDQAEFSKLKVVVQREEALKTDHPQDVQQYKKGKYISPSEQIERNKQQAKQ